VLSVLLSSPPCGLKEKEEEYCMSLCRLLQVMIEDAARASKACQQQVKLLHTLLPIQ
jgi:hypothetical protein